MAKRRKVAYDVKTTLSHFRTIAPLVLLPDCYKTF
jgi:hypothetical protein